MAAHRPAERRAHAPITAFNAERVAAIDWQPIQEFWFESKRGRRIHNMIALPPGFDPGEEVPALRADPRRPAHDVQGRVLHPLELPPARRTGLRRADDELHGLDRLRRSHSRRRSRATRSKGPADEINQAADEAIRRYPFIDASRQAAGGASYGGHLTNWLAVSTDRYRALVSHAGLYDLKTQWTTSDIAYSRERNLGGPPWEGNAVWKDQSPFWHSKKLKTPILADFRRARLPRSLQQRPRILDRAAAPAGREPAGDLPGREPLDPEGREQPLLLQGSAGLARQALHKRTKGTFTLLQGERPLASRHLDAALPAHPFQRGGDPPPGSRWTTTPGGASPAVRARHPRSHAGRPDRTASRPRRAIVAVSSNDSGNDPIGVITVAWPTKISGRDGSSLPSDLTGVMRRTVPTRWSVKMSSR